MADGSTDEVSWVHVAEGATEDSTDGTDLDVGSRLGKATLTFRLWN